MYFTSMPYSKFKFKGGGDRGIDEITEKQTGRQPDKERV